jgi:hypothetical protein
VSRFTRRASLLLIITGGTIGLIETGAFSSTEAPRNSSLAAAGDSDALIVLNGFKNSVPPTEPHKITIENQADVTFTDITINSNDGKFRFSDKNGGGSNPINPITETELGDIPPVRGSVSIRTTVASGKTGDVTDTISLALDDGSFSFSAERELTIEANALSVSVTPVPAGPGQKSSTHTWQVPKYTTDSPKQQINTIELDYSSPSTGTDFGKVNSGDVKVTLTRKLSSGKDREIINVTSGGSSFGGETALIDLSGSFDTNVVDDPNGNPNIKVAVSNVTNPPNRVPFRNH